MKLIVLFELSFATALALVLGLTLSGDINVPDAMRLPCLCVVAGGFGGVVYCLRAIYLNACVLRAWDDAWQPWYYIRPFVSLICGGVSWLFLKAGLLLLDATTSDSGSELGFYALAFIAGLNVDKFISKVEDIAQAAWGIEKSRAAKGTAQAKGE